jgi:hypothetical protein
MRVLIFILTLALIVTSCKKEEEFVPSRNYTLKGRIYNSSGLIKNKPISFTYLRKVTGTGNYNEHFLGGANIDANGYFEFTYPEQEVLNKYPDNYHIIIWQGSYEVVKYIPVHQDIEEEFAYYPIINIEVLFRNIFPNNKNDTFRYSFHDYRKGVFLKDSALVSVFPKDFTINLVNEWPQLLLTRNSEKKQLFVIQERIEENSVAVKKNIFAEYLYNFENLKDQTGKIFDPRLDETYQRNIYLRKTIEF